MVVCEDLRRHRGELDSRLLVNALLVFRQRLVARIDFLLAHLLDPGLVRGEKIAAFDRMPPLTVVILLAALASLRVLDTLDPFQLFLLRATRLYRYTQGTSANLSGIIRTTFVECIFVGNFSFQVRSVLLQLHLILDLLLLLDHEL